MASRPNYGRTRPARVIVEAPDGLEFEAYLKGPYFGESEFPSILEREWFAGRLARQLDLPCATPMLVQVVPEVVASQPDALFRKRLIDGPAILFASLSGGPGWMEWSEAMTVPRDSLQLAANIYLFDTIIQNWDRCLPNPNLLVKGKEFLMIDHGEAFIAATGTDAERDHHGLPWQIGAIDNHVGDYEMHPLWPKLRPKGRVDFKVGADCWKALPTDVFELIAADVPECWDRTKARQIADYLSQALENIDAIVDNIEYNLNR